MGLKFGSTVMLFNCLLGISLMTYCLIIIHRYAEDNSYEALCDISDNVSCKKVFTSSHSRGFGIVEPLLGKDSPLNQPNPIYAIGVYFVAIVLGFVQHKLAARLNFYLSVLTILASAYLAFIFIAVHQYVCVVCVTSYVVNIVQLVLTWRQYKSLKSTRAKPKSKQDKSKKRK